ncbi:MAG: type II secretion system F family protein [Planctomycetes bacterium]|nr:type II secretion system F family protein [Planctomycetota bacterium]
MGRTSQLIVVYTGFATMLEAGISLLRVFEFLRESHKGPMRRVLTGMLDALNQGHTLSGAMADYPRVFACFDRTLIGAAEESGNLDMCFGMLAQWHEFMRRLKRTVVSGLVLPLFVLHIAAAILPAGKFVLGQIEIGGYVKNVLGILMVFYVPAVVLGVILFLGPRLPALRSLLDRLVLWVPVLGKGVRELCIARFSRAFGMLFKAGIPMSECFAMAPQIVGNGVIAKMFAGGAQFIARGEMPSGGFSKKIPSEYRELWKVGEETGKLEECANKIAEISSDRAELLLQEFARWVPRVVYFGVMMFMVKSIMTLASGYASSLSLPV